MKPSAQDVLSRFENDLDVREIRFPLPLRDLVRVAAESHLHAEFGGLPCQVRHDERVAAIRHQDIRILRCHEVLDPPKDGFLGSIELDVVDARPEELVLHPRDAGGIVDVQVEQRLFNGGSGYSRAKGSSSGVQMAFPYRTGAIGEDPWA